MKSLRRTAVGEFRIENAISLENLENNYEFIDFKIIKVEDIFKNLQKIYLTPRKKELFLNGVKLTFELEDGLYNIYSENKYIGLGTVKNNLLKRDVILNVD